MIESCDVIFDSITDPIMILDLNNAILEANNAAVSVCKLSHKEIVGKKCYEIFHCSDHAPADCPNEKLKKSHAPESIDMTVEALNGTFMVTVSPIFNTQGEMIKSVHIARDISERKRMEDELKFRSEITEQLNAAVITTGLDFKIFWVNQAFSSLYGYSLNDVLGKTPDFLNIDPMSKEIQKDIYQSVSSGKVWNGDVMNRKKNGTIFMCELNIFPLKDQNGNIFAYAGHQQDITNRKKAEEEQERLNESLKIKNKELERVLYVSSHDLRSPLVNIEGYSRELDHSLKELMSSIENVQVPSNIKERITQIVKKDIPESRHYIQTSVSKMDALLKGILTLSRLGQSELKIEKIDMNEVMEDIVDNYKFRLNESGIKTEVSKLPDCKGDVIQINQLFSNLIENAIKYSDSERLCIIKISGYKDRIHSIYCVEDNGPGIAPESKDKIFELFYRLDPRRVMGEGMGLSIAQRIIDKHNGKIWVESELGKGSKFFVSLPTHIL